MNKLFLFLLLTSCLYSEEEKITLKYPEGLTWKGVFDAGFRPKLMGGNLSRTSAEIQDQSYVLQFKDRLPFYIEKGRLKFELKSDDSLRMIDLAGRKHLTIEEAQKKIDLFHKVFEGYISNRGALPPVTDPKRGAVMRAGQQSASARTDHHDFIMNFRGSYNPDKPYVMSFMIFQRVFMDKPRLPIRREIVKPPEGYEWFDMTPVSNIPAERQKRIDEILLAQKSKQQELEQKRPITREPKPLPKKLETEKPTSFPWWIIGLMVLLAIAFFMLKGKSKR